MVAAGLAFIALGSVSLVAPLHAGRFLLGFAGSPGKHYVELALRLVVGGAFVSQAPQMLFPRVFGLFGWILLSTTLVLLLIPWHWHQSFARRAVAGILRFLPLLGVVSVALGATVLVAVVRGHAA